MYLALGDREDLGVKLRGGTLLDVKVRTANLGAARFSKSIAGRVEEWTKWSFPVSQADDEGSWRVVDKSRRTRSYVVDEFTGKVSSTAPFPDRLHVCNAELAEVRVDGADYWSVGFEAFSDVPGEQRDVLSAGVGAFFTETPAPRGVGRARDSSSYAAWLRSV